MAFSPFRSFTKPVSRRFWNKQKALAHACCTDIGTRAVIPAVPPYLIAELP
ncbi:hypothetical protein [Paenibacillus chibensis]|uniref:hypothetical protein n=1 Tax=Paenibacillus chibensis TaxID=59846 RepID=UPI002DBF2005|nr:hypothetical protein [Paenibacillus chibensis]MEC0369905.1 hypothetical protein [Paenibacillus chibensis]